MLLGSAAENVQFWLGVASAGRAYAEVVVYFIFGGRWFMAMHIVGHHSESIASTSRLRRLAPSYPLALQSGGARYDGWHAAASLRHIVATRPHL